MIKITIFSQQKEDFEILEEALRNEAYQLKRYEGELEGLLRHVELERPDAMVVSQNKASYFDTVRQILQKHPMPVVIFTEKEDVDEAKQAVRIGVSAYVVNGLQSHRVIPVLEMAIERFFQLSGIRKELEKTKLSLAERKLIEKAKGILMQKRGCNEDEAYHTLRKMAMKSNRRLVEIAEAMMIASDMLLKEK